MARRLFTGLVGLSTAAASLIPRNSTQASNQGLVLTVDNVSPRPLDTTFSVNSAVELFEQSCPEEALAPTRPRVLLSSFVDQDFAPDTVFASSSGFVRGAIEAWAGHQKLELRPESVWFEILVQLNFYMSHRDNAESVRPLFVNHTGQQKIEITSDETGGFGENIIARFGEEIGRRVKADWLRDWVQPGFSTSTRQDELTAAVLLMGQMQHYFSYQWVARCGLPAVRLLGQRSDWQKLLEKLEHLKDFGEEPTQYAAVLRPILKRFVRTWDEPTSQEIVDFWSSMVTGKPRSLCDREWWIEGWIAGFQFWSTEGQRLLPKLMRPALERKAYRLDGVSILPVESKNLQISYAKAPVKLINEATGAETDAYVLAGNVGVHRRLDGEQVTARPLSGWFMYGGVDVNYTPTRYGHLAQGSDYTYSLAKECQAFPVRPQQGR